MRRLITSIGWYLYGGVSCYCMQRYFVDFLYIKRDENELFQSGDIVILDIWNRYELNRNNIICAKSPDDHQQYIYGRVVGFQDESVQISTGKKRKKSVLIPKGSIAINVLTYDNSDHIKILPIGLIEARTLARIWPLKRFTCHLLNMPSKLDI